MDDLKVWVAGDICFGVMDSRLQSVLWFAKEYNVGVGMQDASGPLLRSIVYYTEANLLYMIATSFWHFPRILFLGYLSAISHTKS